MRLMARIIWCAFYFIFGIIITPFVSWAIFVMTLPNAWKNSARIGMVKKRPPKQPPPAGIIGIFYGNKMGRD